MEKTKKQSNYIVAMHKQVNAACTMSQAYKAVWSMFGDTVKESSNGKIAFLTATTDFVTLVSFADYQEHMNKRYQRFGHKDNKPWSAWYSMQLVTKAVRAALAESECPESVKIYAKAMALDYAGIKAKKAEKRAKKGGDLTPKTALTKAEEKAKKALIEQGKKAAKQGREKAAADKAKAADKAEKAAKRAASRPKKQADNKAEKVA